jgi:hypothetical protein
MRCGGRCDDPGAHRHRYRGRHLRCGLALAASTVPPVGPADSAAADAGQELVGSVTSILRISDIRVDGGTQPRTVLDYDTIDDYAEAMKAGAKFPAVTVYYDGENYWLADGFHRVKAAWQNEQESINAEVVQGTLEDAQWHAFSANKSHGLRRTNVDKQRAVKAALAHPKSAGLSDRAIAVHVGVSHQTVADWRKKIDPLSKTDSAPRQCSDGRVMNTANIGRRSESRPVYAAVAQPDEQLTRNEKAEGSNPSGGSNIQTISRERVWAAQETKVFTREILRLVRAYEKSHDPVAMIEIVRRNGLPADISVEFIQREGEGAA